MNSTDPRLTRLISIQAELDARRTLYEEYDKIVLELQAEGFRSALVDDLWIELEDAFANSNTGWTSAAVKRWSVRIEPEEKHLKREAKKLKKLGGES